VPLLVAPNPRSAALPDAGRKMREQSARG